MQIEKMRKTLNSFGCSILTAVINCKVSFWLSWADFEGLIWDVAREMKGYGFGFGKTEAKPVS